MVKYLVAAFLAVGLAACQPNGVTTDEPNTNSNVAVTNDHVASAPSDCGITRNTLDDEKALFVAETAYNVPANAYVSLGDKLPANVKAAVRPKLIQLYEYLKLARAAYNAGDSCSLLRYRDLAKALSEQTAAILPK